MKDKSIAQWAEKINWSTRVNSICKPCWELKYCPYGPLVEQFPLIKERGEKSCRMFGHECPVFYCNEPLTETKDLRRITRNIPRHIQFKVLKRDNQICQICQICKICKKNVIETDIEFDHIIPFSKGGPTEDHNIRLLCKSCNNKRKANYESEFLINSFNDHVSNPVTIKIFYFFICIIQFYYKYKVKHKSAPSIEKIVTGIKLGKKKIFMELCHNVIENIFSLFSGEYRSSFKYYDELQYRWGIKDAKVHKVKETIEKFNMDGKLFFQDEIMLVRMIGWKVEDNEKNYKQWLKY